MKRRSPIRMMARAGQALALTLCAFSASAQYAVSQLPSLTPAPPTNIVVTVDDSGSMQWAYVPDGMANNIGTRRFNAGSFNALAYNPSIYYPPPVMIDSTGATVQLSTCFAPSTACPTGAWVDGFNTGAGGVDLSTNYQPTSSYSPGSSATNQNFSPAASPQDLAQICSPAATCTGAPAYYYIYNPAVCTSSLASDDTCYQYVKVTTTSGHYVDPSGNVIADETGNFANWYSFYRTRHLMIASAAAITMADSTLTQARVTWRDFWTCTDLTNGKTCQGWDGSVVDNRIRTFNDIPPVAGQTPQRAAFYQWLARVPANNSTPTRGTWKSIGDYFSSTTLGVNGPYGVNPNQSTTDPNSGEVACVQNYNITLTDGQWNGESDNFFGAADDKSTSLPANSPPPNPPQYTPSSAPPMAIYSNDANHDVLADIAFHYWSTNLRPDLPGSATAVTPYYQTGIPGQPTTADYWNPQNDPATWPHLVQITIGIGMTSTMNLTGLSWWGNNPTTQYTMPGYLNLYNGGTNAWPSITNGAQQGDTGKAYDLWHAAINSRGLAFSAESPKDLLDSLKASLNRIKVTMSAQTGIATSSSKLANGTVVYVANYTSADWHGTLSAYGITNGTINGSPAWTTDPSATRVPFAAPSTRSIITSKTAASASAASVNGGILFSSADSTFQTIWNGVMGITSTSSTSAQAASANILSWLRGDVNQEQRKGGAYRNRYVSVLGDIVDSSPVFSWHENFGYAGLLEGGNYLTFLSNKANGSGSIYTSQGMVYVGADDGMLHGFDAATGNEVFGYVPHKVVPNMPALADPAYAHQYYVDQTPYVGDACVGSGPTSCNWKTVLVGTTGAGGQGVFALDVTNPETMESGGNPTANVLWDLDGNTATGTSTPNGDLDLGYTIGKPVIARLNNGDWSAIFGNGYLSSRGCAVLFIVRLYDGAITKIDTSGLGQTSTCPGAVSNPNAANGLGPVTLADVDGNMTADYVYAGDLQGRMWKFDLTDPNGNWKVASNGNPLFTATPTGASCVPAATSNGASTCQPITSAPLLGPALPGMTGTMVYFGTGRLFAVGDASATATQSMYGILDNGTSAISGGQGALQAETATDNGATRSFSTNAVTPPKLGWYINLPDLGERITISPIPLNGFVVFASDVPSINTCGSGGSGWIMGVWVGNKPFGGSNQFFTSPSADGIRSTSGMPESLTVLTSPGNKAGKLVVGETGGQQTSPTPPPPAPGRISWHELVR